LYAIGLAAVAGHLKEGKLTALAVTANQRLPMLPEVPTVVEAGFPSLAISNWWGMAAPKQTSDAVIGVLNQAIVEALSDTTVVERFAALGMFVPTQTREQFVVQPQRRSRPLVSGHSARKVCDRVGSRPEVATPRGAADANFGIKRNTRRRPAGAAPGTMDDEAR